MNTPAPLPPAPLAWDWFDLAPPPRDLPAGGMAEIPTADQGGAAITWQTRHDHKTLLARILRQPGSSRPALLLLHGMGLTIATFRGIAPWLLPTHDLVLVDYSGLACTHCAPQDHGWGGTIDVHHLVTGLFALLEVLHLPQADFAGNSLGGGMCIVAAQEQPARVRRLLLSNPACYPQTLPRMYRWLRVPLLGELLMTITRPEKLIGGVEYIGYVDKSRFYPDLRQRYLRNMQTRTNRFRLMEMIRALPGHEGDLAAARHVPRLKELQQPTLISFGEKDPLLFPGAGRRLANDLPRATYDPHPMLAHMPHEEAPEILGPIWAEFLNRGA